MLKRSVPIFAVRDVKETIAFYKDVLGFAGEWFWGDPIVFGGAQFGDVSAMFHQQPEIAQHIEGHEHHYWADEIDELHDRHRAAGAPIVSPIENKPWGIREYTVRDPNGYRLRFSGPRSFEKPVNALDTLPDYVRVELRMPTEEEYRALHKSVGWGDKPTIQPPLDRNAACVVAVDSRDGTAIGMLRVMQDTHNWFSIWDVIVHPEFQAQRIGSAMLKAVLKRLKEIVPAGGNVHLFTMSDSFYEKNGFVKDQCLRIRF